jgi:hypothetical protein
MSQPLSYVSLCVSIAYDDDVQTTYSNQVSPSGSPTEILQSIFKHACIDGGFTGSALSSVCRHVRDVSARTRLQSVSVIGLPRLKLFLRLLESLGEEDRRVRFFFAAMTVPPTNSHVAENTQVNQLESDSSSCMDDVGEWSAICHRILALISQHVQVLTLHLPDYLPTQPEPFPSVPFPLLHDLTFGHCAPPLGLLSMPSLRRLHIFDPRESKEMLACTLNMERLQDICISGFDVHDTVSVLSNLPIHTYQTLAYPRKLIVVPNQYIRTGWCGENYVRWFREYRSLRFLAMRHQHSDDNPRIIVLPPRGYTVSLAAEDWNNVVEISGEGVWGAEPEPAQGSLVTNSSIGSSPART